MAAKQEFLPKAKVGYRFPAGVAVFPKLDVPDMKFAKNGIGSYKTGVRLEGDVAAKVKADIDTLITETYEAAKKFLLESGEAKEKDGQVLLLKNGKPQKDGDGKLKQLEYASRAYKEELDDDGAETGAIVFNTKTTESYLDKAGKVIKRKVTVVDAKRHPLTKSVWGGSKIIINADLVPFYTAIGLGASLRLNGVQVLELRSGGRDANSMFGDEEGYEDEGDAPAAAPAAEREPGSDDDL